MTACPTVSHAQRLCVFNGTLRTSRARWASLHFSLSRKAWSLCCTTWHRWRHIARLQHSRVVAVAAARVPVELLRVPSSSHCSSCVGEVLCC